MINMGYDAKISDMVSGVIVGPKYTFKKFQKMQNLPIIIKRLSLHSRIS